MSDRGQTTHRPPEPPRPARRSPGGPIRVDLTRIQGLGAWEALRCAHRALRAGDLSRQTACFYLAELADGGYQELGHPTLEHCLEHRFSEAKSTLYNHIAVGRALPELPLLDQAWEEGRVSYSVVLHLIDVITPRTQEAWIAWAVGRTHSQVRRQVQWREKGDLPTDPDRRTIRGFTYPVKARLTPTQHEVFWRAVEKLRAEYGRRLSLDKLLALMAAAVLTSAPDDSVPGRVPVKDRFYVLHAQPVHSGSPELVTKGREGELVPLDLEELDELEAQLARLPQAAVAAVSGTRRDEVDLALLDPRNSGPIVPEDQRDVPTPEPMRQEVILRDGFRCRSCGTREELTVHHCHMLSRGGPTTPSNLITLCALCHGSVHEGLTVIVGDPEGEVQFVDRQGRLRDAPVLDPDAALGVERDLSGAGEERDLDAEYPARPTPSGGLAPIPMQQVDLAGIPEEVDGAWFARHRGLLTWSERLGQLELRPGWAPAAPPVGSQPEVAAPAARSGLLAGLVGQDAAREWLMTEVAAARLGGRGLPHVLFTGEPGLGKTLLCESVAAELGAALVRLPAPVTRGPEALLGVLAGLPADGVLFVDEIHGLSQRAAEFLYEAMDKGVLSLPVRQGLEQRTIRLRLAPFTLCGATTDEHELPRAFLSRLKVLRLVPYEPDTLSRILLSAAEERGLALTGEACALLAGASRDTPRRALQLLQSVASLAAVAGESEVSRELVERVFQREGVDADGRTALDRAYLALLGREPYLALRTLAARLGTTERVLRETVEPFLLRRGWITVSSRGRSLAA